jgi:uncharacterized protein YcbK (DUF882 family)
MKFYSEQLNKLFNTAEELQAAEDKVNAAKKAEEERKAQLKAQREERAKAVEEAFKVAGEAQKQANKLLNEFIRDYGSYHTSVKEAVPSLWDTFFGLL